MSEINVKVEDENVEIENEEKVISSLEADEVINGAPQNDEQNEDLHLKDDENLNNNSIRVDINEKGENADETNNIENLDENKDDEELTTEAADNLDSEDGKKTEKDEENKEENEKEIVSVNVEAIIEENDEDNLDENSVVLLQENNLSKNVENSPERSPANENDTNLDESKTSPNESLDSMKDYVEVKEDGSRINENAAVENNAEHESNIERLKELKAENLQLTLKNNLMHKKLAEYFKKRKIENCTKDVAVTDEMEQNYHEVLLNYEKNKIEVEIEIKMLNERFKEAKELKDEKLKMLTEEFKSLQSLEKSMGQGLIFATTGKPIPEKVIEKCLSKQRTGMQGIATLHKKYVFYKQLVDEQDAKLQELENLSDGLHVRDYERLQAKNQKYLRKMEEGKNDLERQKNLCMHYQVMLAHIREEIHFEDERSTEAERKLVQVEMELAQAREKLNEVKRHKTELKSALKQEHEKAGLLAKQDLLKDYEKSFALVNELQVKQDDLLKKVSCQRESIKKHSKWLKDSPSDEVNPRYRPRLHRSVHLQSSLGHY